jgi:hypothetical protein
MIKASLQAENPSDIEFTLSITMPLRDWKRLRDHLDGDGWPMWEIGSKISGMVRMAEMRFDPPDPKKDTP